ncbi:MAG: GIY-YIG nuclease family protein [Candidatus Shapirobacteria bacterium]|nr:GIY-YIG nuclease family protein [Candidatus Shapirobacteria bacterium]MDD3002770.1 GIY-YIG nuclease family protein [Candidatus Shapirobacteria bacterium]MDD4383506.1 GIY-YIG nuclease family protein [Candidatus Shapirobacteria bacterium]
MIDLTKIPSSPGVYIYKNSDNKIIYIGKAVNLKKRVSQYFKSDEALGYKTKKLVSQIAKIDFQIVSSEIEALILESSLIKQYRPKFNSQLKDDKSYIYITISKDKIPLIKSAFKSNLNKNAFFYGPFPDSAAVKSLLKTIKTIFPFYSSIHGPKKCLYCHLNLCPGPDPDIKEYKKNILKIKNILNGNFPKLISKLEKEMFVFSKSQNFEMAKIRRDQVNSLKYIISGWKNLTNLYQKVDLQEDQISKSLRDLKTILSPYFPSLKNINRFEAYDISNSGSKYFVGSMTVFQQGRIAKDEYRKFKIYSKITPDDQFMIKEIIYRRLKHPEWQFPDFILVDGGKPQVSAAMSVSNIPIIGLAKKEETIVVKINKCGSLPADWREIKLSKNSPSLQLLQQLRDEAHRFSNKFRKELISKTLFKS